MSDDLRDAFGEDIFAEPEEEALEGEEAEAQNRMFLIAVAVLGGLLLVAIGVFLLWVFVINPSMQAERVEENAAIQATNTAIAEMVANGGTVTSEPIAGEDEGDEEPEETVEPTKTDTPEPTATDTPVIKATNTPTPEDTEEVGEEDEEDEEDEEEEPEEVAEAEVTVTATSRPRRSPTPTRTPRATNTPSGNTTDETPETGLGEFVLVIAGGLLIGLIVLTRRLRSA